MDKDEENKTSYILLDSLRAKVDFQLNADNGLDTKSGVLLALIGTVVVFYAPQLKHYYCYLAFMPLVTLGMSAHFLLRVLNVKEYNTGLVDVYDDTKRYRSKSENDLLRQLLSDYQKAFDDNGKILKAKNVDYRNALNLFFASVFFMIVFLIII